MYGKTFLKLNGFHVSNPFKIAYIALKLFSCRLYLNFYLFGYFNCCLKYSYENNYISPYETCLKNDG